MARFSTKCLAGIIPAVIGVLGFAQPAYAEAEPGQLKLVTTYGLVKCLDIPSGDAYDGQSLRLWDCWTIGNTAQDVDVSPDGTMRMKNYCLEPAVGTGKVQLKTCTGGERQKWEFGPTGMVHHLESGKCLTHKSGDDWVHDYNMYAADCNTSRVDALWHWDFKAWGPITTIGGKCVNVPSNWWYDGGDVEIYDCNQSLAQKWYYEEGNGLIHGDYNAWKANNTGGYCLSAPGTAAGTVLKQAKCDAAQPGQKWEERSVGQYVNPASGLCLGVQGGNTANGTKLELENCL